MVCDLHLITLLYIFDLYKLTNSDCKENLGGREEGGRKEGITYGKLRYSKSQAKDH